MHFDKRKALEDEKKDRFAVNTEDPAPADDPEEDEGIDDTDSGDEVEEVEDGEDTDAEEDTDDDSEDVEEEQEEPATEESVPVEPAVPDEPANDTERNPNDYYPILIRCAAARGDSSTALSLKSEYETAKERFVEQEAFRVIQTIEEGARSGTLFQEGGVFYKEINASALEKIARMFDTTVTDNTVTVSDISSSDSVTPRALVIASDGTIQVKAAGA